jgi:hypothetical protein
MKKTPPLFILILLILVVAACAGDQSETLIVKKEVLQNDPSECPVTPYSDERPPDGNTAAFTETWFGSQALWAGLSPAYDGKWYAGPQGLKVLWYRAVPGKLTITGKEIATGSTGLLAEVPGGYGETGIQSTSLVFPSEGCWEIIGRVADQELPFVVHVYPADQHPVQ